MALAELNNDIKATLYLTKKLLKAIQNYEQTATKIKLLHSQQHIQSLCKQYGADPNNADSMARINSINWRDLKPAYEDYEFAWNDIRTGLADIATMKPLPKLSDFLEEIRNENNTSQF